MSYLHTPWLRNAGVARRACVWTKMFFLGVSLSACAGMGAAAQNQARIHTDLATRYYQAGQIATAVQEAKIAERSDSTYVPAQTILALMYAKLRQTELADQYFQSALSQSETQDISSTDLRNSYAWYLCQTDRYNQGLVQLSQVLRDPLYASMDKAFLNAGVCAARAGQLVQASDYVKAAIEVHPNFTVAQLYRAHIEISMEDYTDARRDVQYVVKQLGVDNPEVLWLMARLEYATHTSNKSAQAKLQNEFPMSNEASWLRAGRWQWF